MTEKENPIEKRHKQLATKYRLNLVKGRFRKIYREWTFETPGFDGVLSDGLLLGNNGGYLTITLYP